MKKTYNLPNTSILIIEDLMSTTKEFSGISKIASQKVDKLIDFVW